LSENLYFETEEDHPPIISIHGEEPVNEFVTSDSIITTSIPHAFLLGHEYEWPTGNWTAAQRNHLLGQFTLIPAKTQSLLGYMFDITTQFVSINRVIGYVKGKSITAISSIIEPLQDNSHILQKAISKPNIKGVKQIINTIVPYLQFKRCNIQYEFFQSHQVKPKLLENIKHYGNYTAFIMYLSMILKIQ